MKLCFSTFVRVLILCKTQNRNASQRNLVVGLLKSVYPDYDNKEDALLRAEISRCCSGKRELSGYIYDKVNSLEDYQYTLAEICKNVVPLIDPNQKKKAVRAIIGIIERDSIEEDTIVDVMNQTPKSKLDENVEFARFITGVFLYVLKFTGNANTQQYVAEVNEDFLKETDCSNCDNKKTTVEDVYDDNQEEISIEAQKFCIKYEKELDLLPLCQIANYVDPLHKDCREIYTAYKLCSKKVKQEILNLKDIPVLNFNDRNWLEECIRKYDEQVLSDGLSSRKVLGSGAKYLHKAYFDHSDCKIQDYNPMIFDRPFKNEHYIIWMKGRLSSLDYYIIDYYWLKAKRSVGEVDPPFDYLWDLCALGRCEESKMTFWICKFVISSSYQMVKDGEPSDEKWKNVCIRENHIQTQEDLYYYTLLQLYWLYRVERTKSR